MKIYLHRKILLGFLASIVIILGLGFSSYLYFSEVMKVTRWGSHARKVLFHAEQVRYFAIEIASGPRGYALTGDESFLEHYASYVESAKAHIHDLDSLTKDNRAQQERIVLLTLLIDDRIAFSQKVIQARQESFEKARDLVIAIHVNRLMNEIIGVLDQIQSEENDLIASRSMTARKEFILFVCTFIGLIVSTLTILVVLTFSINSNLRSRTLAEAKLKEAELKASNVNQELEAFSYSVSHDLRAPLRSISGYAQILKEDYSERIDAEGNRVIDVIMNNARRMGQLIDDLLNFSRLSKQEIKKSKIRMNDFVRPILKELTDSYPDQRFDVNLSLQGSSLADPNMIRQVWINLLSNAIKYSQKRDISKIEIGSVEGPKEMVYYVKDNGVGFDMQYQNKLFGVFQRLHKTKDFEGTGVGLALIKRIIERHQGRVWAEAKLNEGATFFFSIPN